MLKQEKVIALLCTIAKLIKEVVNLFSSIIAHINIQSDQGSLHKRHDFFEFLRVLLDHILIQSVVRVHELSLLLLVLAKLGEILLIQVMEEALHGVLRLLKLRNIVEIGNALLALNQTIFSFEVGQA